MKFFLASFFTLLIFTVAVVVFIGIHESSSNHPYDCSKTSRTIDVEKMANARHDQTAVDVLCHLKWIEEGNE